MLNLLLRFTIHALTPRLDTSPLLEMVTLLFEPCLFADVLFLPFESGHELTLNLAKTVGLVFEPILLLTQIGGVPVLFLGVYLYKLCVVLIFAAVEKAEAIRPRQVVL